MAQRSNFEIPAQFIFRPYRARWIECLAEVIGWCEKPLVPGASKESQWLSTAAVRVNEGVQVKLNVSPAGDAGLVASGAYSLDSSYTVVVPPAKLPPELLRANENRRNAPEVSGRSTAVLMCFMSGFATRMWAPKPHGSTRDAWEMREEFLNLRRETEALRLFLNHWGLWNSDRGYEEESGSELSRSAVLFPSMLWQQQDEYRRALTRKPDKWLSSTSPLFLSQIEKPPYFVVQKSYCEGAIRSTITIDHLSHARFGICRRDDCRKLFEHATEQRRLFCTVKCAHLANVRKLRALKKKQDSKRKGVPRNAKS